MLDKNSTHYGKVKAGDIWARGGYRNRQFIHQEVFLIIKDKLGAFYTGLKIVNSMHVDFFQIKDINLAYNSSEDKTWVKLNE